MCEDLMLFKTQIAPYKRTFFILHEISKGKQNPTQPERKISWQVHALGSFQLLSTFFLGLQTAWGRRSRKPAPDNTGYMHHRDNIFNASNMNVNGICKAMLYCSFYFQHE